MTPEEIAKLNQGSIDTANRLNASAGVPTTLTSQNMSSASPVVLPTKTDNTDYQSILNGATSQVNSIQSQLDKYNTDQANQAKIAADTAKKSTLRTLGEFSAKISCQTKKFSAKRNADKKKKYFFFILIYFFIPIILYIPVPHFAQVPFIAERFFPPLPFIVTSLAPDISLFALHFTQ